MASEKFIVATGSTLAEKWDSLSDPAVYRDSVYFVQAHEIRRQQIIEKLDPLRAIFGGQLSTLNMGAGPLPELNDGLLDAGHLVTATDFIPGMKDGSLSHYQGDVPSNLEYVVADSRKLNQYFDGGRFHVVISVNSILAETREDNDEMFRQAYMALKDRGKFVAVLVPWEYVSAPNQKRSRDKVLHPHILGAEDTTGIQCFHSRETIRANMADVGFGNNYTLEQMQLDTSAETSGIKKIYKIPSETEMGCTPWMWLLTATR